MSGPLTQTPGLTMNDPMRTSRKGVRDVRSFELRYLSASLVERSLSSVAIRRGAESACRRVLFPRRLEAAVRARTWPHEAPAFALLVNREYVACRNHLPHHAKGLRTGRPPVEVLMSVCEGVRS